MDAAAKRGVAMVDPAVRNAVTQFQFSSTRRFMAVTDSAGRFRVENLPPGKYTINAARGDYFDAKGADTVVGSGKTADVALSMIPGATISGRVLNPAGRPMPNATVTAYSLSYQNGLPVLDPNDAATSDDRGDYRIFWLPPGEYYVGATPRSTLPARTSSNVVTLSRVDQIVRTYYPAAVDALAAKELKISRRRTHFRHRHQYANSSGSASHFRRDQQLVQDKYRKCRTRSCGHGYSV